MRGYDDLKKVVEQNKVEKGKKTYLGE